MQRIKLNKMRLYVTNSITNLIKKQIFHFNLIELSSLRVIYKVADTIESRHS